MSKLDENQILARLEELSHLEPTSEATGRTVRKIRDILMKEQDEYVGSGVNTRKALLMVSIAKFAVAALIFVGFGFFAGRLSAPKPLDMNELQVALESSIKSSLEPLIKQDVLVEFEERLVSALNENNTLLKDELQQQVDRDLNEFAARTVTASRNLTEQRFRELIDLIEAARERDRRQIEAALSQIRQQTTRFGSGLVALVTQADEALRTKQN
jgi:hypothetical protein